MTGVGIMARENPPRPSGWSYSGRRRSAGPAPGGPWVLSAPMCVSAQGLTLRVVRSHLPSKAQETPEVGRSRASDRFHPLTGRSANGADKIGGIHPSALGPPPSRVRPHPEGQETRARPRSTTPRRTFGPDPRPSPAAGSRKIITPLQMGWIRAGIDWARGGCIRPVADLGRLPFTHAFRAIHVVSLG